MVCVVVHGSNSVRALLTLQNFAYSTPEGLIFGLPVVLDSDGSEEVGQKILLKQGDHPVAVMEVESKYDVIVPFPDPHTSRANFRERDSPSEERQSEFWSSGCYEGQQCSAQQA